MLCMAIPGKERSVGSSSEFRKRRAGRRVGPAGWELRRRARQSGNRPGLLEDREPGGRCSAPTDRQGQHPVPGLESLAGPPRPAPGNATPAAPDIAEGREGEDRATGTRWIRRSSAPARQTGPAGGRAVRGAWLPAAGPGRRVRPGAPSAGEAVLAFPPPRLDWRAVKTGLGLGGKKAPDGLRRSSGPGEGEGDRGRARL